MQNLDRSLHTGAFFLSEGNLPFVQGQCKWTKNRQSSLEAAIVESVIASVLFVAAIHFSYTFIASFFMRAGFECGAAWLFCGLLAARSVEHWDGFHRHTDLVLQGVLIYGELLNIDYETDSEGNPLAVVHYAFTSPSGSRIEKTERGTSRGKFPTGDTTGIYILYLTDNVYIAL